MGSFLANSHEYDQPRRPQDYDLQFWKHRPKTASTIVGRPGEDISSGVALLGGFGCCWCAVSGEEIVKAWWSNNSRLREHTDTHANDGFVLWRKFWLLCVPRYILVLWRMESAVSRLSSVRYYWAWIPTTSTRMTKIASEYVKWLLSCVCMPYFYLKCRGPWTVSTQEVPRSHSRWSWIAKSVPVGC